jgi:hypothetical protein
VPDYESRGQGERDQKNQGDGCETVVGDWLPLSRSVGLFGAVTAGVQKSVFEGPIFRQIHPTVVLILPAAVPQLADNGSGEYLPGQCRDPQALVVGGMRSPFSLAAAIAFENLFGAHHTRTASSLQGESATR